jgi:SAM-dependent methyltransferase
VELTMAGIPWLPAFACGCREARGTLTSAADGRLECTSCGAVVEQVGGVYRCLPAGRQAELEPFIAQYRVVRDRDGYRVANPDYYRALPYADRSDPQAAVWAIRRRSYRRLRRLLRAHRGQPTLLDLGAGSGWLSHRLSTLGWRAVAVDLLADDRDGLGACAHYGRPIARVQADFDALPLAPSQFDAVVFNGSLHYAPDVDATVRRAVRLLRAGGVLVVVDSPIFERDADGDAMRARQRDRLRREYGVRAPIEPGEGFLTFDRLGSIAAEEGLSARFFASSLGWRRQIRQIVTTGGTRDLRSPQFGVWIAA